MRFIPQTIGVELNDAGLYRAHLLGRTSDWWASADQAVSQILSVCPPLDIADLIGIAPVIEEGRTRTCECGIPLKDSASWCERGFRHV